VKANMSCLNAYETGLAAIDVASWPSRDRHAQDHRFRLRKFRRPVDFRVRRTLDG